MSLRIIKEFSNDIYENLAAEQAILHYVSEKNMPSIRFWVNTPSVVLGRNQSLEIEVNQDYCEINDIAIARRISGGGCVYHDMGNVNWSVFLPTSYVSKFNFKDLHALSNQISYIFINSLKEQLEPAFEIMDNTSVLYKKWKISGSAGYIHNKWYLHHGTLLHNANLTHLENALLIKSHEVTNKRTSNYYRTINMHSLDISAWKNTFSEHITNFFDLQITIQNLSDQEKKNATLLEKKIYRFDNWINSGKRK